MAFYFFFLIYKVHQGDYPISIVLDLIMDTLIERRIKKTKNIKDFLLLFLYFIVWTMLKSLIAGILLRE